MWGENMIHAIEHSLLECIKLMPFLFLTFLFIELLEHKFCNKTQKIIYKSGKLGPIIGSLLGLLPQCGFSVVATNLYITRVISVGTLISIYLTTSDEMLPIMLSRSVDIKVIIIFLLTKLICGIIFGLLIDLVIINKNKKNNFNYNMCDNDHCDCDHGIFKSTIKHTIKILIFIFVVTLFLNILFEYVNKDLISKLFLKNTILAPFISSLIGLIPNCGASVILTELFLNNIITFGTCISGLLTSSGVALIILFKTNKNFKENISILTIVYLIGVLVGIFIELLGIVL